MASEFYLTLPSNASTTTYPDNAPQAFKVDLAQAINLNGNWEVALMEMQYPNNWINLTEEAKWIGVYTLEYYEPGTIAGQNPMETLRAQFSVLIPSGNYPTIQTLCRKISQLLSAEIRSSVKAHATEMKWLVPVLELVDTPNDLAHFKFDETTKRVFIETYYPISTLNFNTLKGEQVLRMLGLFNTNLNESSFFSRDYVKNPPAFDTKFQAMFVYFDAIEYQSVGDTKAPLIRTVPFGDKFSDITSTTFTRPYYLPLRKNYIKTIEIQIRNDAGDLIQFEKGKTILILHFRKRNG